MLPRADAPARRLPYTTADMSERLAKKKAEQEAAAQAQANQAFRTGVTNPPAVKKDEPWYRDALGAVGGAIKSVYENIPMSNPVSTPVNMGGDAGVSMGGQGTVKSLVTEPARLAVRRAVGDITAIPRVGEPSPSYTADQIREQGVARGVLGAAIDYSQFIPVVAKGAGFTGDAVNAYKLAMMERQANPFPALRGASNVIDVVPGSRLPARIVDAPAIPITPATRLAETQAARGLTAAVNKPMTLPSKNITTIEKSGSGGGQQKLVLTNSDGRRLATVTYDLRNEPMSAMPSRIEVDYLKSNFEGQGHGQELMQNLYDRYPNSFIDWGITINPTSTYMAEKFADRYYDRTAYEPDIDQGVVGTEGMYSGEPDVFDPPPSPATRLGNALAQMTLDARAAQGGVRDAGVIRFPGGEPTPELPSAQLQREAARAELGINIQDIEFPPQGKELLRPRMVDTSGYGVFPEGSWPELGLAQYNAGVNNVTMPEEMKALRNYFSNNYDSFQDILRDINNDPTLDITKSIQKQIEQIDNIFRVTSPTTDNFKVFRGVIAGSNMPLVNDRPFVGAFYRSLKEGDLIVEPAYMSTSINKVIAREWADSHPDDYLLIIHVPKGSVAVHPIVSWEKGIKEIKTHINAPTEQELLFNRGTVLRIIDNDMGVIHAEMVLPDEKVSNPISTSGLKESLLKQYSYKDLAEMVADEEAKISFYEEHLQSLPDVKDLMTRTKGFLTEKDQQITRQGGYLLPGMIMRDLASTIADLNKYASGSPDPGDYWTFRDIVNQITQANHSRLAKPKDHQHYAKQLLSLLDKHRLLDDDIVQFIQDNLEDVLMLNKPNP